MKHDKCYAELTDLAGNRKHSTQCKTTVIKLSEPVYVKQEPYVDDQGIWMPLELYVPEGCTSNYQLAISKEIFIEAYNKWIKED